MDRREFLKGSLAGLFGVLLSGLGTVKAEDPETIRVQLTGSETVLEYRWFFAPEDSDLVDVVLCDGQDITDWCTKFYGPKQPRKLGWGVACVVDDPPRGDENGNVITHLIEGAIEWNGRKPDIAIPVPMPQGGIGRIIIDRDLWVEGDSFGSVCRQVERSQEQGEHVSQWVLDLIEERARKERKQQP